MPRHLLAGLQGACFSQPRLETLDQAASRNSMAVLCLNPQGASQPAAQHSPAAPPAMPTVPSHHLPPAHYPPIVQVAGWKSPQTCSSISPSYYDRTCLCCDPCSFQGSMYMFPTVCSAKAQEIQAFATGGRNHGKDDQETFIIFNSHQ